MAESVAFAAAFGRPFGPSVLGEREVRCSGQAGCPEQQHGALQWRCQPMAGGAAQPNWPGW
ncbi:hypothetical protein ACFPK5_21345 [Streptomyces beijiangensis]|uniref:hypothetical protein n=1 Tax=Streptomyces beijiangensis TaxID=163361 RepID=UPI0036075296